MSTTVINISRSQTLWHKVAKAFAFAAVIASGFFICQAFAAETQSIGNMAAKAQESMSYIGKLMIGTAYIAGIGFSIAGIFKFKQHRDNPTQIPIGTPIALLVVGVVLVFLPSIVSSTGETLGVSEAGGWNGSGNMPGSNK